MPPEAAKRIWDAAEACRKIQDFTQGHDLATFQASALLRSAVERQMEIVGEALGKASVSWPQVAFSIPEIPRIIGLRNRLIHGYDAVDDELIWDVVITKIPPLRVLLDRLLIEDAPSVGPHLA